MANDKIGTEWFHEARYGMFIHFGLYSMLGRGEWALNREAIPVDEYKKLADSFSPDKFDAGATCDLAVRGGMRYVVFTTMHHDGFCLYDTKLTDFNSVRACGRDLTGEIVEAAKSRGLKIVLYHSLNHWTSKPDAVDALEDEAAYETFIDNTFERIRELVTLYNPIDTLWYDGWWPFNAEKWKAEEMNAMVREIQPHIMFNGRNGLPGDFATPEGHMGSPSPWRPWEGCMTLNNNWGYHKGDHDWKSPSHVMDLLATAAQGRGNLLLNIGPRGDGSVPEASVEIIETVGDWLGRCGEAIYGTDTFTYDLQEKGDHRGDWNCHGQMTAKGNALYQLVKRWPGNELTIAGLQGTVKNVTLLGEKGGECQFEQQGGRVTVKGLPDAPTDSLCPVLRFECDAPPSMYLTGGLRVPNVPHPRYDPCPSDLAHGHAPG